MEEKGKIFEDWEEVECEDCEHWWTNSCDGFKIDSKGSKRLCNGFKVTRRVILPEEIKTLKIENKRLLCAFVILAISNLMLWILVGVMLNG